MRRDGMSQWDLDAVLRAALVVEPPLELRASLMALVATELPALARPADAPGRAPAVELAIWGGFVALTVGLAAWQAIAWLLAASLVLGDVRAAVGLVVGSPAATVVGDAGLDLPGLALWAAVAVVGWAASRVMEPRETPPATM